MPINSHKQVFLMGYKTVERVMKSSRAKGSARLVLMVLATHADDDSLQCFPSRELLCQEAAMEERNLIYSLKQLETIQELVVIRGGGRGKLSTYQLTFQERVQNLVAGAPEKDAEIGEKGCNPSQEKVQELVEEGPDSTSKGCNPSSERVQDLAERVQDSVIKGAGFGDTCKEEPSGTIKEPSEEPSPIAGAPAAGPTDSQNSQPEERKPSRRKSAGKKPAQPKSQFHDHPSVVEYRRVYKTVSADQATLIAQATGESVEVAPAEWQAFVTELALTGNKSTYNVRVIVGAYERYRAGMRLRDAIDAAWRREKGEPEPVGNNALGPYNRGKPTITDRNQAAVDESARRRGVTQQMVIDVEGRRM
jgi:hypothetical protein